MNLWAEAVLYRILSTIAIFMYTTIWFHFVLEEPQPVGKTFWYMFWATIISTCTYYVFRLKFSSNCCSCDDTKSNTL